MIKQKYCGILCGIVIAGLGVSCFSSPVYAQENTSESNASDTDSDLYETSDNESMIKDTEQEIFESENSEENETDVAQSVYDSPQSENSDKSFGNAVIDMNSDGVTDENDTEALRELSRDYDASKHSNQEMPGELTKILYGDIRSSGQNKAPEHSEYYLNNLDQATSVKNQLSFGTCWTFASVAGLESSVLKQRQALNGEDATRASEGDPVLTGITDTVDISEKYTAWTIYDTSYREPTQNEGMVSTNEERKILGTGGWTGAVEKYWTSWRGVVDEKYEPYRADGDSDIYTERFHGEWSLSGKIYPLGDENATARVNNAYLLPSPAIIEFKDGYNTWTGYDAGATDLIKRTLVETGSVVISYKADQSHAGESGNSEFFNKENWCQYIDSDITNTNHAVAIVGWNDNYPAENFLADRNSLPAGDGAWLVKNSWGSYDNHEKRYGDTFTDLEDEKKRADTWGIRDENGMGTGYFWLSYYDKSIANAIAFEADIPDDGWDHDRIYQYDLYNDASSNTFVLRMYDTGTTVANVFTAGENEQLDAVSVRISEPGSHVNVKVYLLDPDKDISDPSEGKLVSELDTIVELAGFKTLKLDDHVTLKPGQRFAVTETIVADSGYENKSVSFLNVETIINESLQNDGNMNIVRSSVYAGEGESFAKILNNGAYVWMTPDMLTNAIGGGVFTFGNALIKAYTTLIEEHMEEPEPLVDNEDPAGTVDDGDAYVNNDSKKPDSAVDNKNSSDPDDITENIICDLSGTEEGGNKTAPKAALSAEYYHRSHNVAAGKDHDQSKAASVKNDRSLFRITAAETGEKHYTHISALTAAASVGVIAVIKLFFRHKKRQETKLLS